MMSAHAPIGVFDSGLGGLTVLRALIDVLPDESMVYFGDNARSPYGPKPHAEVHAHAVEIADLLVDRGVKALVVACNSATAAALDTLQDRLSIPVVGVIEPGLRAAMNVTRTRAGRRDRHRRHHRVGLVPTSRRGDRPERRAHVRGVPRVRGVRRGGRRRFRPGPRARRASAGARCGTPVSTRWCSVAPIIRCSPVRSGTRWAEMWCWCRARTRPRSRSGTCWRTRSCSCRPQMGPITLS